MVTHEQPTPNELVHAIYMSLAVGGIFHLINVTEIFFSYKCHRLNFSFKASSNSCSPTRFSNHYVEYAIMHPQGFINTVHVYKTTCKFVKVLTSLLWGS